MATISLSTRFRGLRFQKLFGKIMALFLLTVGSLLVMLPLVWMLSTSLKTDDNAVVFPPEWIPRENLKVDIDGKPRFVYNVPINGEMRQLAFLGKKVFVNPSNPTEQYTIDTPVAKLQKVSYVSIHWENYFSGLTKNVPFFSYMGNTLIIVFWSTVGVLISCILVAYGFSRFRAPWIDILFLILLSTIMLPAQVTLIPTFVLFQKLGWYDTYLPLIVPAFFANAWDVFLLRQFFMTVPLELDDAAKIDGAGPLGVLWHILLPQAWPAVATVSIFHILYAWNDFFGPLIYLQSQSKWTVAIGLQSYQAMYSRQLASMMSAATVTMLPCLIIFFIAQRLFIQGVVVSGIKG